MYILIFIEEEYIRVVDLILFNYNLFYLLINFFS